MNIRDAEKFARLQRRLEKTSNRGGRRIASGADRDPSRDRREVLATVLATQGGGAVSRS